MEVGQPEPIWFRLRPATIGRGRAVGELPGRADRNWMSELARPGTVADWPEVTCELHADAQAAHPLEVLSASFAALLVSSRLKALIAEYDPTPQLEWLPVTVTHQAEPTATYWAPSLLGQPQVFIEETIHQLSDGGIFLAGLDIDRAEQHRFLAIHRGQHALDLHGHHELRAAVDDLTGNGVRWATSELSWPPDQLEAAFDGSTSSMLLPGGPGLDALPTEVRAALDHDLAFYEGEPHAESGPVVLRPAEFVVSRLVPVERAGTGDTIGIRVVDFTVARHWRGSSADLLVWLPDHQCFATYDADHARLHAFLEASWDEIADQPGRYLNAMWENPLYYTDTEPPPTATVTTTRPPPTEP